MCKFRYRSVVSWHEPSSGAFKDFEKSNDAQEYHIEIADICRKAMRAALSSKNKFQEIEKRSYCQMLCMRNFSLGGDFLIH
jgi:hypothetical protein